jgi:4-hydroxybenzoate polyprenyltransferase
MSLEEEEWKRSGTPTAQPPSHRTLGDKVASGIALAILVAAGAAVLLLPAFRGAVPLLAIASLVASIYLWSELRLLRRRISELERPKNPPGSG